jgi:capsular polysaccharide transport system permease protein
MSTPRPATGPVASPARTQRPSMSVRKISFVRRLGALFWLTVVLPTVLSIIYFGLWASDVYTSESSFVVRSPEKPASSPLGVLLKGVGFAAAHDDSQTVQSFIVSRDALRALDETVQIKKAYASDKVDLLNRFAGVDPDDSFEALFRYYQGKVKVVTDPGTSITTLSLKAFSAQDAVRANQLLLERSEALVNRLNERGRKDLIRYAQTEVEAATRKAKDAALALSVYRNRQGVIDPERQAAAQLQQIAKLQDELIATTTQLAQLKALTPQNPQIQALRARAKSLREEIEAETGKVTGPRQSLSNKAAEFQRLVLESDFANRQLASAMASLESARNEAQRQQIYLERISQPSLPDVAQEPRRLRNILSTFLLGLMAWGILSMLIAGVREHQD